jgi:hypothetical protein
MALLFLDSRRSVMEAAAVLLLASPQVWHLLLFRFVVFFFVYFDYELLLSMVI